MGILSVGLGAISYLYFNPPEVYGWLMSLYQVLFGLSLLLTVITMGFLVFSIYGYEYAHLPAPSKIAAFEEKLSEHYLKPQYSDLSEFTKSKMVEKDMEETISKYYETCLELNRGQNIRRSGHLHWGHTTLVILMPILGLLIIVRMSLPNPKPPTYDVHIVEGNQGGDSSVQRRRRVEGTIDTGTLTFGEADTSSH